MKREDDQSLWNLLGKAPQPRVSAFFARNVLRKIREKPTWRTQFAHFFRGRQLIPAAALGAAVVAALLFIWISGPGANPIKNSNIAGIATQDYEVVADLDDLVASEENNLWTDNSSL